MNTSVYWIRHKDHTDMFSQGYIGVSKNVKIRWAEHFRSTNQHLQNAIEKYGWDNLVKEIILIADEKYCYEIELKLRNAEKIGWNLCVGGGKPPSMLGKKRPNHAALLTGRKRPEHAIRMSGNKNPMSVEVKYDGKIFKTIKELSEFLNKNYMTVYNRVMQNPKRWGYEVLK
jgi:dissimilatory sulfite reductase (desulfoviridin) alpha/beta subunit